MTMTSMDLMALLSTVVLVATIATTFFAVAVYAVSRGYTKKKTGPKIVTPSAPAAAPVPPILKRYNPFEGNA